MSLTCPRCGRDLAEGTRFCPYDGARMDGVVGDPLLGLLIAKRYRVTRALGSGGMAHVYLAHHGSLNMDVAFKVLRREFSMQPTFVARFAREAQAVARIDHPNVVSLFDFGRAEIPGEESFYYLVMEYVSGRSLDVEVARSDAMSPERCAHILSQIAAGVGKAHSGGIVHRDLKPANVMLRQRGSDQNFVTILDFGLSRSMKPDKSMPKLTATSDIVGTPHYMAPERFSGDDTDKRSDIYALGVIGYELLTGTTPFDGAAAALVFKHLSETPARPSERLGREVHAPLEDLVMRCMEKDPADRFQNAEELMVALGEAWRSLPRGGGLKTTYAATSAAPPRPKTNDLPDPTVWQSKQIDALTDGPSVIAEIGRLLSLRRRHLADLAVAIWRDAPPERVGVLRKEIDAVEAKINATGEEVALIESQVEELERSMREREALLRVEVVRASLELTMPEGIWDAVDTANLEKNGIDPLRETVSDGPSVSPASLRIEKAERTLASLHRAQLKDQLARREELADHVVGLRSLEAELEFRYEELAGLLDGAVPRGSQLQPQLVAFQKLDGAIAAYKSLLALLAES